MRKCAVLVDGNNFTYRQHYTRRMLNSEGRPTSVLYGVPVGLLKLKKYLPEGSDVIMVWDGGGKTWRHRRSKGVYKANRNQDWPDRKMVAGQKPMLSVLLKMMGVPEVVVPEVECDDVIGILATGFAGTNYEEVCIVSTDHDFYQLLNVAKGIKILLPDMKMKTVKDYGEPEFFREWGLYPDDWPDVKALCGDSGDNIPNLQKGLGLKTAVKLVKQYRPMCGKPFDRQGPLARKKLAAYAKIWKRAQANYELVRILTYPANAWPMLSTKQSLAVDTIVADWPEKGDVLERRSDAYKKGLEVIAEYELAELFLLRHKLWQFNRTQIKAA